MTSPASAVELGAIWVELEPEAQVVLMDIARRLKAGQAEYGKMDVLTDGRDYFQEAAEEALDFAVYAAMERLKRAKATGSWTRVCDCPDGTSCSFWEKLPERISGPHNFPDTVRWLWASDQFIRYYRRDA